MKSPSEKFIMTKMTRERLSYAAATLVFIITSFNLQASCSNIESLSGCSFSVKRSPLSNLIPITSQGSSEQRIISAPSPELYKNGSIRVVSPYVLNKMKGYKVIINGNGKNPGSPKGALGEFFIPQNAMTNFLQVQTATVASESFGDIEYMLSSRYQCNLGSLYQPDPLTLTQGGLPQKPKRAPAEIRENIRQQRRRINRSPAATYEREQTRNEATERGQAPVASGASTSTADGSGLINMREDDPNADNETEGCEVLRNGAEENEGILSEESLTQCLSNLREKIFAGMPRDLQNTTANRDRVFKRMVNLPNEEQEFLGAIFTVKGEANDSNPIEGAMVLKVLSNRRNNANALEDQIKACEESGGSIIEIQECNAKVNAEGKYNLLDIAIDPMQFSMYNTPELEGNWNTTLGPSVPEENFGNSIRSFLFYSKMEEVNISGGGSNTDIDQVYHYNTTSQYNAAGQQNPWNSRTPALDISVEVDGETFRTSSHKFYYNVDTHGEASSDGWRWTVKSEFKNL